MKPTNKEVYIKVGNLTTAMLHHALSLESLDDVIPGLCCGTRSLVANAKVILEETCGKVEKQGNGVWLATNINNLLTKSLDLMCSGLPSVEEWKKVPKITTNVKAMEKDVQY